MANGFQSITQAAQAAAYPDLAGHRVSRRFGFDQLLQGGDDGQIFFFVRGRPPPGSRTRSTGRSTSEAANSWRPRRIVFSSTDAGDFKQDSVGTVPKPLRLHGQIPAPLLLIQPTQQQIHVPVVLTARMGFIPRAGAAPAFMDGLSWHTSVSSPSARIPALYAIRPLDRKPQTPELVFLHALSAGERVLEIGCGTGVFLPLMADSVGETGEVVGVDRAPAFVEQARQRMRHLPQV